MQHAPRRTCVGCRTTRAKPELVRFVATPEGVVFDPQHRLPGRGAYVCPTTECLDRIERAQGRTLRRALRDTIDSTTPVAVSEARRHLTDPHGIPVAPVLATDGRPLGR